jgi:hypothetical protein
LRQSFPSIIQFSWQRISPQSDFSLPLAELERQIKRRPVAAFGLKQFINATAI